MRDSSFIKLVPYIPEIDEEGKRIPGGEIELFPEEVIIWKFQR